MERMVKLAFLYLLVIWLDSCNHFNNYTHLNKKSKYSIAVQNHFNDRGAVVLNKRFVLSSRCELIEENEKSKILKSKNKNTFYFAYAFVPYNLVKKEGDDFFYVIKRNDTLKYKIKEY